ncbi:hypothetical protein [Bacillus atrophaeus]|uniref:Uncharacterized protein n=1 Tax=Bacillus atrophaeus (strain 1942) TaxID=720555 RepID=A0ABM5LV59_BACA1|nr:hypothetical protein [Bacillus atrophaeus]AMR63417.1 hypothetical protein A1D11_13765 [Bacillus subtilis subsp. globigii]ADP31629.1 hypothetical protein BATR1942_03375 [Bacillus atrophaeus 1942]EIM10098.1 hypothetical protein UY9_13246 [Bacillus atrophaeus C89]MBG9759181.1 hypothetical protein [Bacillus atrophaeus]MCM3458811.1 hypothetical protein [Bacillus atrophaeus]
MDGRQLVSISLAKSRAAIMAAKNALLTPWSAVRYPIKGQGRGRNKFTFCFTAAAVEYLITFVIAIAKAEAFSLSASNRAH